jgi:2'-5' RNA ligase
VFSLNAPLPSAVPRLALDLAAELPAADARPRGEHTLLLKRLGDGADGRADHLVHDARDALSGTAPFEVRISGVDLFEIPTTGPAPVVYLAVESPGLDALHDRLCARFDPVPRLEGDDFTPHVTVARGGDLEKARRLASRSIDPIDFVVDTVALWDAYHKVEAARFSLPM